MVDRKVSAFFTATVFLLAAASAQAAPGKFYLSTDRIFAPGQQVEVKLEANGVAKLQVRVYSIADPRAWFDAQADLHRPSTEHSAPRPAAWSLLRRGARRGLTDLLHQTRSLFGRQGRAAVKGTIPETYAQAQSGDDGATPEVVLPPLEGLPLLDAWQHPVSETEGWTYDTLSLPPLGPGAYLVEATSGREVATTVVLVSEVALLTKQSSAELLVWAVDPASGDPRPGTEITVLAAKDVKARATTGADGIARFELGLLESPVIYARRGKSFSLLDPRFYPANLPEPRVYVFTERPVYRPGQEVFFKGFVRELRDEAYVLPEGRGEAVELEVLDPKGQSWTRVNVELSARGSFDGAFELPEEPAIGTWELIATLGGKRYSGQFKVLTFVKPEVRLDVRLDGKSVRSGQKVSGDVVGAYYFGAPYPEAEVKITVSRTRFYIPWWVDADYSWYYSEAEYRNTAREVVEETTCTLDARGECTFSFVTREDSEDHTYVVEAAAIDPTGKTITGSAQATVTRGAFRLVFEPGALVVTPGAKQEVRVRAEDYSGKPVQVQVELEVTGQHLARDGVVEKVEVARRSLTTGADGRATLELEPRRGGYYELRATAQDDAGQKITAESFLFASEGQGDLPFAPSELELVTDKVSYFAGESALVLILAPAPEARVLFTMEGGALYRAEVIQTRGHAALVKVEIGEKQTPNFYLTAACVTGGQVHTKQRSVIVPPREKLLTVEVAPDRPEAGPGEDVTFTVSVTDYSGKPVAGAEVALSVVDEAIYAISPEIAVPLEAFFHPRKRNDVRTQESVSFRFFGTSEPLPGTAARWSGDPSVRFGSLKPQVDDLRRIFKDTAGWAPALITDAQGRARTQVKLPDNLTAWRATARVITAEARVGLGTGSIKVKKPLIVRLALAPRLMEGDTGQGAVVVQNLSGASGEVEVGLEITGDQEGDPTPPALSILGQAFPRKVTVENGRTERLGFAWSTQGSGRLKVVARARSAGYSDSLESIIDVGEWASIRRASASGSTSPEQTEVAHELQLPEGARPSEARVEIELVSSNLAAIRASLPYLIDYPYGCTEQTMSRFVPLLAARASAKTAGVSLPELTELPRMIAAGQGRIAQLQQQDGAWGWWEQDGGDAFMTAWVLEGLAEARALGEPVDPELATRGAEALVKLLGREQPAAVRAFSVYALARHGRPMKAMIDRLLQEVEQLPAPAVAHLLLAARAANRTDVITRAQAELAGSRLVRREAGLVWWGAEATTDATEHPLEATALVVLALLDSGGDATLIDGGVRWLLSRFEDQRFGTTRQTALAVRALARQLEKAPPEDATITVSIDGVEVLRHEAGATEPAPRIVASQRPKGERVRVVVTQAGGGVHHHTVALVAPVRAKSLSQSAHGGLKIQRNYLTLSGAGGAYRAGQSGKRFRPGDTVLVHLRVDAEKPVEHVMIEDPHGAGLTAISSDSGVQVEGVMLRPEGLHREHRDDRTSFFYRRVDRGTTDLYYLARAGLGGTYRVLPSRVESMYLPNTHHGQSDSAALEVSGP